MTDYCLMKVSVETSDQWMPKGHNGDKEISNNALEFSLDDEVNEYHSAPCGTNPRKVLANCLKAYKMEMALLKNLFFH